MSDDKIAQLLYSKVPKGVFRTPFGERTVINADSTASGYVFSPIDDYMQTQILPFYNNTHSNSFTGQLMSKHMSETYKLLRKSLHCKEGDKIILTGNGCTGAVNHLVHLLKIDPKNTAVVLSIVEHHSNALPWRETKARVEFIEINEDGMFNLAQLKETLEKLKNRVQHIYVSLSAGSNVTGVLQEIHKISKLVHKYDNAHIFFDFACIAPYVPMNMHTNDSNGDFIDGLFFSPHKFLGGQGTTGVLVINERLICSTCPYQAGGGIVKIVSDKDIEYASNIETREVGGTPNILGVIRLGKILQLKTNLLPFIEERERILTRRCHNFLEKIDGLTLYNPSSNLNRVPIFVFNIQGMHHNLVVKQLSDLFGINTRGGVACCNLYAHKLLHCDCEQYNYAKQCITHKDGVPDYYGFVRVSFNYCMPDFVVSYILYAIKFISTHGKKFASKYRYKKDENCYVFKGFDDFSENSRLSRTTNKVSKSLLNEYIQNANKALSKL